MLATLKKHPAGWLGLLLVVMVIVVGLTSTGCTRGLQAVGWSGGSVADGMLYVGSSEGRVVAVDLADEGRQWSDVVRAPTSGYGCISSLTCSGSSGVAIYGTPVVSGDSVYIGAYSGKIYSFTSDNLVTTGRSYPSEGYLDAIVGGLVVHDGLIYFGCSDGKVYALDEKDLILEASFETGDKIWSTPAISGETLFIGSFDKNLYALNAGDLSLKWSFTTEGAVNCTPLVYDGTVYFGSFDRNFYALDEETGSLKWKIEGGNWFWASPVAYEDEIYAPCLDGKVYIMKADTGKLVTDPIDLGSPISSSPVVVGGSVILATREGIVYSLGTADYGLRQMADLETDIYGPLSADGDVVYIHPQGLTLYRLNVTSGAMLRSISLKSTD